MATITIVTGTVKAVKRLRRTASGNARFAVTLTDGVTYNTRANSHAASVVNNYNGSTDRLVGQEVSFLIDGRDSIVAFTTEADVNAETEVALLNRGMDTDDETNWKAFRPLTREDILRGWL